MPWKRWNHKKRIKPNRPAKSQQARPVPRAKERPTVSIEEIRRNGLILAGQGFREGVRSQPSVQGRRQNTSSRQILNPPVLPSRAAE